MLNNAILFQLSLTILVHYRCILYLALEGGPPVFKRIYRSTLYDD